MKFNSIWSAAVFSAALLNANPAAAGVLIPIAEVPGSVPHSTEPWGINDHGTILGAYQGPSDQSAHGFVGNPNGPYTLFDAGPNGTNPRGNNNAGWIVGISNADNCGTGQGAGPTGCVEFERSPSGVITPITVNGVQAYGIAQGINSSGVFVGNYHPAGEPIPNQSSGFYGYRGQYVADLTLPFPTRITAPRSINDSGTIVGWFLVPGSGTHGFVLQNGAVTVVDFPNASGNFTSLNGVNNQGVINGNWTDADGNTHAFLLSPDLTTFTDIVVPGATTSAGFHINDLGEVAITSDIGGFVYCSNNGDSRCNGGNAQVAAQSFGMGRSGSSTSRCFNGCRNPHGAPPGSVSPADRFPEPQIAPNSRGNAYTRIQ